ncbi:hypothetical protein [Microbacterium terrisoli]|uniref:hypothetical protein n=1 Tax=Microbacterium terrisoli TaxID=3242192 RepID=UPI00351CCFD7
MPARRTSARTSRGAGGRAAIPQLDWRAPQPAPIVLVSGPEDVCAERAIAGVRDYLRAEDPSLEVSDLRADDYEAGTLMAMSSPSLFGEPRLVRVAGVEKATDAFLTEALAYLGHPQEGATVLLRHTGASVRGKKATVTVSGQQYDVTAITVTNTATRSLLRVTPSAPELIPADECDVEATVSTLETEGVVHEQTRDGDTITVTATADDGYVIEEGAQTEWTI